MTQNQKDTQENTVETVIFKNRLTDNQVAIQSFLTRAARASLPKKYRSDSGYEEFLDYFKKIEPDNYLDAMVFAQLSAIHSQIMALSESAHSSLSEDNRNQALNQLGKMSRAFNTLLDSHGKHKRGGKQTIQVNHVHVHDGSQAIVGNIEQKEGGGAGNE